MRILLVSTYELGHQPLHVASPAGRLRRAGHDVAAVDVAVDPLDPAAVRWAEAVAVSVPMHTAARLARNVIATVRRARPDLPICTYGLYAGVDTSDGTPGDTTSGDTTSGDTTSGDATRSEASPATADLAIAGEYEEPLVAWVDGLAATGPRPEAEAEADADAGAPGRARGGSTGTVVSLGRTNFGLPARDLLPALDRYAALVSGGRSVPAGAVEASHGCAHRCTHCPVPVVYDGRTRLVGIDALLADVAELVRLGAGHVTFADPDFLNGPHHARRVVDAVHGAFPQLTFDVTVKVEHILRHRDVWGPWAGAGLLFVVSAFESASEAVLRHLAKGHTVADELEAVAVLRAAGVEPRPSLLPFTPWTSASDIVALFDLVARADLVGNVDPVQFSIRLLVPPGSLLLRGGMLDGRLDGYDAARLGFRWRADDPRLDALQEELARLAEDDGGRWDPEESYAAMRGAVARVLRPEAAGRPAPRPAAAVRSSLAPADRPRLTEAWFCCAEPTDRQLHTVAPAAPAAPAAVAAPAPTAAPAPAAPRAGVG